MKNKNVPNLAREGTVRRDGTVVGGIALRKAALCINLGIAPVGEIAPVCLEKGRQS